MKKLLLLLFLALWLQYDVFSQLSEENEETITQSIKGTGLN